MSEGGVAFDSAMQMPDSMRRAIYELLEESREKANES